MPLGICRFSSHGSKLPIRFISKSRIIDSAITLLAIGASIVLFSDECSVPSKDCVMCNDRVYFIEEFATEDLALLG